MYNIERCSNDERWKKEKSLMIDIIIYLIITNMRCMHTNYYIAVCTWYTNFIVRMIAAMHAISAFENQSIA